MKQFWEMLKAGSHDFLDDECLVSGAALAYYTIFALPPLLVLVFFIAGLFNVSEATVSEVVRRQVGMPVPGQSRDRSASLPPSESSFANSANSANGSNSTSRPETEAGAEAKSGASHSGSTDESAGSLQSVAQRQSRAEAPLKSLGPISKLLGILILIFSATGVFAQLQRALNRAWEVEPDPEQGGWKSFLAKRGLSLGLIIVIAFLLLVSLILTTLIDEVVHSVVGDTPGAWATALGMLINNGVALLLCMVLFAGMFKFLPDADMRAKDVWVGAAITAVLFVVGKTAIGWYLQRSQIGSAWGSAAAAMVALLVWVYYTSLIVLFGAELTQVWARRHGHGIQPSKNAVRVVEEKRHVRDES